MAPSARNPSPPPLPSETNHKPAHLRRSRSRSSSLDLNILSVVLGDRLITPWFPSLYREELIGPEPVQRLYVCPRCFRYVGEVEKHVGHLRFCDAEIPGHAVYAKEPYAIYELDGEEHILFTQNLSLFAKLFIENKSVCFDVNTFLYYLLVLDTSSPLAPIASTLAPSSSTAQTTKGKRGRGRKPASAATTRPPPEPVFDSPREQIVGFFSKEKLSWDNNNLACILVFPPWQKTGLGQLLMSASYEISRREGRLGGPERPLSALGKASYLTYWSRTLAAALLERPANKPATVKELSEATYMLPEDVLAALGHMDVATRVPSLPAKKKSKKGVVKLEENGESGSASASASGTASASASASASVGPGSEHNGKQSTNGAAGGVKVKMRKDGAVMLEKGRVREWIARGNVDIKPLVEADGFVGAAWGELAAEEDEEAEEAEEEEAGEEAEEEADDGEEVDGVEVQDGEEEEDEEDEDEQGDG